MIEKVTKDIKALFGKDLVSIVLFGSFASGKQKEDI